MPSASKKPMILICDDEEGVRESFKVILSDDYSLRFTKNSPEAVESLKTTSPAAVLLDIKMPKKNGAEILRQIKKLRPSLPVIIVTGYQSVELAQQVIADGAADYIPKPFAPDRLLKALAAALKK